MVNAISTLVGEVLEVEEDDDAYIATLTGKNGSIYGIPIHARRAMKFNPVEKSTTHIGPDFGDGVKWIRGGAMTGSGIAYCVPYDFNRGILKIDTNTDTVTELDRNLLPERGNCMWGSCATALDGCIYFMTSYAHRIMKLDPNNNDAMSSVGDDFGDEHYKYIGTVVGIGGCAYGIPLYSKRILKYDPINDITSFVGKVGYDDFNCTGNGALGRDGCIYAMAYKSRRVLKNETTNNIHCFVGNRISDYHINDWGDPILGIDGCIYWPPYDARRILKYDPHTNQTSLVGDYFDDTNYKWYGGSLASDGVVYCFPRHESRILSIDPRKEYTSSLENIMIQHPEQLGCIFHPSDDIPTETKFDRAVTKFGFKRV